MPAQQYVVDCIGWRQLNGSLGYRFIDIVPKPGNLYFRPPFDDFEVAFAAASKEAAGYAHRAVDPRRTRVEGYHAESVSACANPTVDYYPTATAQWEATHG